MPINLHQMYKVMNLVKKVRGIQHLVR